MKFKEGDKAEFIYRNKKSIGVINGVYPGTREVSIKQSDSPVDLLFSDKAVAKIEEQERLVVPQFVADWIEYCKKHCWGLSEALEDTYENSCMPEEVMDWFEDCRENQELFARAWLDGYEVEKEPLYYVIFLDGGLGFLNVYYTGARLLNCHLGSEGYKTKFTESEIKNMDARYWAFAVPVEEVEETE
ncbi:DUF1642 domain-containing protein [Listeria monocytogenes]|nr:DUF1642 domain-containing protein [Listeria monocytogenes]EAE5496307.1 DUF1642 domain-containing protein [Listeria monocytogenes]